MSEYESVNEDVIEFMNKTIESTFPSLNGCWIQPVCYSKKKKSKGKYVICKLQKPNKLMKHIYSLSNGNELDYVLLIDINIYESLEESDKRLMICNALEYADVDLDKDEPYNLRGAEVETFYDEIDRTKDDALWQQRIQTIADSVYTKDE